METVMTVERREPMETELTNTDASTEAEPTEAEQPETDWIIRRPRRAKLTAEESIRRTQDFINNPKRREQFIASIRKSKG